MTTGDLLGEVVAAHVQTRTRHSRDQDAHEGGVHQRDPTIYFFSDGEAYYADFDAEWVDEGGDIEIDPECDGACRDLDFTLECELDDKGEEMECDGDGVWKEYELECERQ